MVPEELKRRISSARAKALGEEYEEIPAVSVGDGEPITLPEGVEPKPEVPVTIPQELLEREAASKEAILANLPPAPLRNTVPKKVAPKPKPEPIQAAAPTPTPSAAPTPTPSAAPAVEPVVAAAPAADVAAIPEKLLRRSAEARAKASGRSVEEVLAEMTGAQPAASAPVEEAVSEPAPAVEAPAATAVPTAAAPVAPAPVAAAPVAPAPAGGSSVEDVAASLGMPEKLLRRSAEARAKALGVPLEQVLADTYGVGVGGAPPAAEQATVSAAPQPAAPVVGTPAAPVAAAPAGSVVSLEEAAAKLGMPEKLLRRSAEAKAKALGVPLEQVLADMLGVSAPGAEQAPVAAAPQPAAPVVEAPAAPVAAAPSEAPVTVEPAGVAAEPQVASLPAAAGSDEVDPWPALFRIEFFTAMISAVFLVLLALAGPAPLFEPASEVVDPSKAPWYLLWMQQLLAWLQPQVAAFFVPLLIIVGLFAVPFIDRSTDNEGRRVGVLVFGFFVLALVVLTILGFISRASGFGYPWLGA